MDATSPLQESTMTNVRVHANNFDAVRLAAALLVICSHQYFFLGRTQPALVGRTLGEMAVMIFFVISGYLVAESWCRDPHVVRFVLRRFLRLWPALAVATIVITLASVFVTTLPPGGYFGRETLHFVTHNLQLRVVYSLPGVFSADANKAMSAVNGSWWTIPLEMKCYLYLAFLGIIGLRRRWLSLVALGIVGYLYFQSLPGHPKGNATHNLRFLDIGFFMTGVCARQFTAVLVRFRILWSCAALAFLIYAAATVHYDLAIWAVITPLVLIGGSLSTPWLRAAGRFGDLSYGIYIYGYFVQQLTVRYWPRTPSLAGSLVVASIVAMGLAWCSWHAVEAPALRLKRHLRRWFPDQAV
jgi:peptidoglycan/LPS O-acetylase OafA/YrhL